MRGLVYVCGFTPDAGETGAELSEKVLGGTLPETLTTVELSVGGRDRYIAQDRYHQQFTPTHRRTSRPGWRSASDRRPRGP
jgi:hypothetical protein